MSREDAWGSWESGRESRRIVGVGTEGLDGEERVPALGELGELELVQGDLGPAEALVVLEALLPLPEHDQEGPAEDVAGRVLERLPVLRLARVSHHPRLPLLQPPVVVAQVCLHVRV